MIKEKQQIIAGPCAAESERLAMATINNAKRQEIPMVRLNLWKPRTKAGGFEGAGEEGLTWLSAAAGAGLGVALEVMLPEQAEMVMEEVLLKVPHAHLMLWIGSRNQNHLVQREIAGVVAGHQNVELMLKNQPWPSEKHWLGMVDHALAGGIDEEQLVLCHRGFTPNGHSRLRNVPDLAMAEQVKLATGLPMILDPSHIGGAVEIVKDLVVEFGALDWVDGQIIETHTNPKAALTDAKQQLDWQELAEIVNDPEDGVSQRDHLEMLRGEIDDADMNLLTALAKRMEVVEKIGRWKSEQDLPVLDQERFEQVLDGRGNIALDMGLDPSLVGELLRVIHRHALQAEESAARI